MQAILDSIESRFPHVFHNTDSHLAAVVNPKFKLNWADNEQKKYCINSRLIKRVQAHKSQQTWQDTETYTSILAAMPALNERPKPDN